MKLEVRNSFLVTDTPRKWFVLINKDKEVVCMAPCIDDLVPYDDEAVVVVDADVTIHDAVSVDFTQEEEEEELES